MPSRTLILGPHGAGKSTLVRQVMSLYERRTPIPGGVGELPLGYRLHHPGDAVVLGNYEEHLRDQYGMHQFERYRSNFVAALECATTAECSVLMEGGFCRARRLKTEEGRRFSKGLALIWLEPDDARRCARGKTTDHQYLKDRLIALHSAKVLVSSGAEMFVTRSRDEALRWVCETMHAQLDCREVKTPERDER